MHEKKQAISQKCSSRRVTGREQAITGLSEARKAASEVSRERIASLARHWDDATRAEVAKDSGPA
jgi:hypothetical protein